MPFAAHSDDMVCADGMQYRGITTKGSTPCKERSSLISCNRLRLAPDMSWVWVMNNTLMRLENPLFGECL